MKLYCDKTGSALVLTVIVIAVITVLAASLLNITMSQLRIKKSYSEVRKSFYLSEDGLNNAYLRIYDLICEASEDSLEKAGDYLELHPDDLTGASDMFANNYKLYMTANAADRIESGGNPHTEAVNKGEIVFIGSRLTVRVRSKYSGESKVEKYTAADIIISVPDYSDTKSGDTDFTKLLYFDNFQT